MKARNVALAIGGAIGAAVAVKLVTRPRSVNWDDVFDLVPHSDRSHFVNVDGMAIHYQAFGDRSKPPIILIHGYTASVYVWKTTAPLLAEAGFHVIALDLLGFGFSDKPSWFDYSIQSQARMVSRFMNRTGIGRASVVGNSYGGAVALTLALDYPERVGKLVLVDAVINNGPKNHPILKLVKYRGIGEIVTPFIADSRVFMRQRMNHTLARANHHLITKERIAAIRLPLCSREGHRSLLATSRAWDASRIEDDLHLINAPTLIIWGEHDSVIPIKDGHKLHQEILNSRFVVLRDCGHVPQEEKSEIFAELVSGFCGDSKGAVAAKETDDMRVIS